MIKAIAPQNKKVQTIATGGRISKSSPHLLHLTRLGRAAFRSMTVKMPPSKNNGTLNEPRSSTAGE